MGSEMKKVSGLVNSRHRKIKKGGKARAVIENDKFEIVNISYSLYNLPMAFKRPEQYLLATIKDIIIFLLIFSDRLGKNDNFCSKNFSLST